MLRLKSIEGFCVASSVILFSAFAFAESSDNRAPSSIPLPTPSQTNADDKNSKDEFTLFHPTPDDKLREFSPDRPGTTNSALTIDAGHAQLEFELFNYSQLKTSAPNGVTTTVTQISAPTPSVRIGLTNSAEIGIAYQASVFQETKSSDGTERSISGIGDTNLTFKKNMLGNDGGPVSWAYMLGIKIPTDRSGVGNQIWEPSLMIPVAFNIGAWGISIMPEIDFKKNGSDNSLHSEINAPITIGHSVFESVDGYIEIVTHTTNEMDGDSNSFVGAGLAWKPTKGMQFDLVCNFGINAVTPQTNPLAGFTVRF